MMLFVKFDVPVNYALGFQDAASPTMVEIISFHHFVMIYLVFTVFAVLWIMLSMMNRFDKAKVVIAHKFFIHGSLLEIVWTITPAVILLTIAFPSFKLLYLIDEVIDPAVTIKVIGHQWYWSYEYSDYVDQKGETINFDSYMIREEDLAVGQLRQLEVDNKLVVPVNTHVRLIITAADVLHSWAVPSLGVKLDAVPGRLNQTSLLASREGLFYGQCSEICGFGHQSMPIVVEAVSLPKYCAHIDSLLNS
jgi:cytochrome c oxidase subunit 2